MQKTIKTSTKVSKLEKKSSSKQKEKSKNDKREKFEKKEKTDRKQEKHQRGKSRKSVNEDKSLKNSIKNHPHLLPRPKMIVMRYVGVIVPKDTWKTQFYDFLQRDFPFFVKRNYHEYEEYFLKMADENAYFASSYSETDLSYVVTTMDVCLADSLPIWAIFCLQHFDIFEDSFISEFPVTSKILNESIIIGMLEGTFRLDIPKTVMKFLKNRFDDSIPIVLLSNFAYYFYEEQKLTILKYTTYGDLSNYFAQFIDPDKEGINLKSKEIYQQFVAKFSLNPEDVMFISGNVNEIKKSARAGLCVVSTIVSNVNAKYTNIQYVQNIGDIEFFN